MSQTKIEGEARGQLQAVAPVGRVMTLRGALSPVLWVLWGTLLIAWLILASALFVAVALGLGAGGTSAMGIQELAAVSVMFVLVPVLFAVSASSLFRWGRPDSGVLISVAIGLIVVAIVGAYSWW